MNLLATVRDKHGQNVNNLTRADFKLEDDGHPQSIKELVRGDDLPLFVGLLVDTSLSMRNALEDERKAGAGFLTQVMREQKDKAFLLHFDREVELLQDFTASRQKLQDAMQKVQPSRSSGRSSGSSPGDDDELGGYHRGGTALYDAVFLASDELLKSRKGRKAVVIFSDGVDSNSTVSLARAIESAQRADTVVYTVYVAGEQQGSHGYDRGMGGHTRYPGGGYPGGGYPGGGYPGGGYPGGGRGGGGEERREHVDGRKIMERIAHETGGRFFEKKKENLDEILAQIQEDLRNQYIITFAPDHPEAGFHKITLTTTKSDMEVQTRQGYYYGKAEDTQ